MGELGKNLVYSVESKFLEMDNEPEVKTLCREIQWLLEDVVVEDQRVSTEDSEEVVKLRTEMDHLYLLWKRRIKKRRPFQYTVGCEHWRDLILCVQDGVLIPRPETEKIVELVEEVVAKDKGLREGLWANLGTESGALAIAIGKVLGIQGKVITTDLSPIAASVADYNVKRYDLQMKNKSKSKQSPSEQSSKENTWKYNTITNSRSPRKNKSADLSVEPSPLGSTTRSQNIRSLRKNKSVEPCVEPSPPSPSESATRTPKRRQPAQSTSILAS